MPTNCYEVISNISFVSMDAVQTDGSSLSGSIADTAPSVADLAHASIRRKAVDEMVAEMAVADPLLGEIFVRRLGLGNTAEESIAAISKSLGESPATVRRLFGRAWTHIETRARFHPEVAYLQTSPEA